MIMISKQSLGVWGKVFGDRIIPAAIVDPLRHRAVTLDIRANPYRLWCGQLTTRTLSRVDKTELSRLGQGHIRSNDMIYIFADAKRARDPQAYCPGRRSRDGGDEAARGARQARQKKRRPLR